MDQIIGFIDVLRLDGALAFEPRQTVGQLQADDGLMLQGFE